MILKQSIISNKWIPLTLFALGGIIFPFIAELGGMKYQVKSPILLQILIGCCIGGVSIGIHQLFKQMKGNNENS